MSAMFRELLDFRRERQRLETRGTAPEPPRKAETSSAVVIAGRGVLDQAAAELVADAIHFRFGIPVQCPSLGGLTAIGAFANAPRDSRSEFVILISVGEVTPAQVSIVSGQTENPLFAGLPPSLDVWMS